VIVAVTGANGFLGRPLCAHLAARGAEVRALVRDPAAFMREVSGVRAGRCRLPDEVDEDMLAGADVVLHAAWATRETDPERARQANEDGTRRVVDAARRAGARVLFVSSIAARPDAPSHYGRSKYAMEQVAAGPDDAVVRPGLVLAASGQGLFQQLRGLAGRLHVVPLFGGGRQPLQTVHIDDVCEAVARVIERRLTGIVTVAEPDPVDLGTFLRLMTREMGVRCLFVPLPLAPILATVRTIERLGVPFPLRSESLLGMQGMQRVPVADSLARLGLEVRSAAESLRAIEAAS
jgi:nucleoside-diphosphate-sugar epimerase